MIAQASRTEHGCGRAGEPARTHRSASADRAAGEPRSADARTARSRSSPIRSRCSCLAGLLLIALVPMLVKRRRGTSGVDAMVPTGSANGLEAICEYLRKEVAEPALHEHTDRFIKYIWSVFFFVLTVNILGLLPIPVGVEPVRHAPRRHGHRQHLGDGDAGDHHDGDDGHQRPSPRREGLSRALLSRARSGWRRCSCPVEIIGLIAKVFALAVRLFANMIAGHILLAVLLSFILAAGAKSTGARPRRRRARRRSAASRSTFSSCSWPSCRRSFSRS